MLPTAARGRRPSLWVADVVARKTMRQTPRTAAAERGYYRVDSTDAQHLDEEAVEAVLARQEAEAAPVLRRFLNAPRTGGAIPHEIQTFVALLAARSPWLRRFYEQGLNAHLVANGEAMLTEHGDVAVGIVGSSGVRTCVHLSEALPLLRDGAARAVFLQNQALDVMWDQARYFAREHFPQLHWQALVARGPLFVTSDRPVTWQVPGLDYGAVDSPGALRVDGAEVTVPLSARVALFGVRGDADEGDVHVDVINERTAAMAERFIFAPSQPMLVRALALRRRHEPDLRAARAQVDPKTPLP